MDHLKIAADALIAILAASPLAQAAAPTQSARFEGKSITVLSDSTAKAKPEITKVVLHFTSYGWTAEKSGRRVDQNIKKFLDHLANENIPVVESEIGNIRLKPSYQFNRDLKTNVPADFLVTRQLTLTLRTRQRSSGFLMSRSRSVPSRLNPCATR